MDALDIFESAGIRFISVAREHSAGLIADGPDQIGDAPKEAIASGCPSVLEIMATQELGEPFRRDALEMPQRLFPEYQAYSVAAE